MTQKARVVVTRRLPAAVESRMMELFDPVFNETDEPMTKDQLKAAIADTDVLVPTLTDIIDADVIAAAGDRLKMIANYGAGVDHIDLKAANDRKIVVSNTPNVLTEDTADMVMAMILAVPRRIFEGAEIVKSEEFKGWAPTWMLGTRIWGKKLGIVGMGRIGCAVARRARAFGLEVHYHNRNRVSPIVEEQLQATYWDSLDQMLSRMDIVSLNCPQTPSTYHILHSRRLKLMQPHSYLVNTSRGEVLDEDALVDALEAGHIAGAALDVFRTQPAINPRLLSNPHVILLPHMGSATVEGRVEMGEKVIINIRTVLDKHVAPDRVYPSLV